MRRDNSQLVDREENNGRTIQAYTLIIRFRRFNNSNKVEREEEGYVSEPFAVRQGFAVITKMTGSNFEFDSEFVARILMKFPEFRVRVLCQRESFHELNSPCFKLLI